MDVFALEPDMPFKLNCGDGHVVEVGNVGIIDLGESEEVLKQENISGLIGGRKTRQLYTVSFMKLSIQLLPGGFGSTPE